VAIAQEQSISKAAQRFYLSQADLSRHLKNVEKEMGAPLFQRVPGGVRPTQAGLIFVSDAQAILHMESELEQSLAAMRHRMKKLIWIMVDSHFQNQFLKHVLPAFQARHPDFTLEISPCNATQARRALLDGQADLALFFSLTPRSGDLEYLSFVDEDMMMVFPQDYRGPTDLAGLRSALDGGMFISLFPVGTTARTMEEQELIARQLYPTHILEGGAQNILMHVKSGDTCGIVPRLFCTPEVRSCLRVGDPLFVSHHVIAYPANAQISPVEQDLMQIIMEKFSPYRKN
jgi:DNA-binding transcriptional LysR family regulator